LEEDMRRSYLKKIRNPNLDYIQKKDMLAGLIALCKKTSSCPHCESVNGSIKKLGALKLIHEKFKKKKSDEEFEFKNSFATAMALDSTIRPHVSKAQEDLNPLRVLRLFERISDEDCELLGLNPSTGRPELFIWTNLPVPPVTIRPSVFQETTR
jgi:DNA-directed RNA polymerase III subunit RPC1